MSYDQYAMVIALILLSVGWHWMARRAREIPLYLVCCFGRGFSVGAAIGLVLKATLCLALMVSAANAQTVLLDFTATWCGPCQQMAPVVAKLQQAGYPVRQVDVDREKQLASQYRVTGIPCFVLLVDGKEVERTSGAMPYEQLKAMLDRRAPAASQPQATGATVAARSKNFVVTGPRELAQEIAQRADECRRDLAVEWLGRELPNWAHPCTITVKSAPNMGAGGATSFKFDNGEVYGWRMTVQGSRERLLDSVIPHEVLHTVFASHFREPIPRWVDEGACTSLEHPSEQQRHQGMLLKFLQTGRGIAFSQMLAMETYPADVMPLYAQGHSATSFLMRNGGQRKLVQFIDHGLDHGWEPALRAHYGIQSAGQFQSDWLAWVKAGSPKEYIAASTPETAAPQSDASVQTRIMLASVRVKSKEPQARSNGERFSDVGSGTIISQADGLALVLTCGHLFRDTAGKGIVTIDTFGPDGLHGQPATLVCYDLKNDVALVSFRPARPVTVAPVAESGYQPAVGDLTYNVGGNNGDAPTLRTSRVTSINKYLGPANISTAGPPVEGRSGGGLFSADGRVIGVCNCRDPSDQEGLYAALPIIWPLLERGGLIETQYRQSNPGCTGGPGKGGYAPPVTSVRPGPAPDPVPPKTFDDVAVQPPAKQPPLQPIAQPEPPAGAANCQCDLTAIVAKLDAISAAIADCKCHPGEACQCDPSAGCKCDNDKLKGDLIAIVDARLAKIKFPDAKPVEINTKRHIVVVADRKAAGWSRLSDDIKRAQQAYSGIRIADPPEFAVPLPQIVAYENGIPVKVIQGSRDVSDALAHVARGDVSLFPGVQ